MPRKPVPFPTKKLLLLLLIVAVLLTVTWYNNKPIDQHSGTLFGYTLMEARGGNGIIFLEFAGDSSVFRITRNESTEALLQPDLIGRDFLIRARRHHPRSGSPYYEVYALEEKDGPVYLTWQETAQMREDRLGGRMLLGAVVFTLLVGAGIFHEELFTTTAPRKDKARKSRK